jgi:hypothetical protein
MNIIMEKNTVESIKHPMNNIIKGWSRNILPFDKWYFNRTDPLKKRAKINRFVDHNDFWIKHSNLSNEEAVRLKHKALLDKNRMLIKLKELDIKLYEVNVTTHIRKTNAHVNFSRVYYKGKEIIY